jgi:hypothetical protein
MIIYNVTIKVANVIAVEWLQWLQDEHIPEVVNTGCFTKATVLHLFEMDDTESITYAVQYHAESRAGYHRYIEIFADTMRKKSFDKWGDRFIAFRTVMQIVN